MVLDSLEGPTGLPNCSRSEVYFHRQVQHTPGQSMPAPPRQGTGIESRVQQGTRWFSLGHAGAADGVHVTLTGAATGLPIR